MAPTNDYRLCPTSELYSCGNTYAINHRPVITIFIGGMFTVPRLMAIDEGFPMLTDAFRRGSLDFSGDALRWPMMLGFEADTTKTAGSRMFVGFSRIS